MEDVHMDLSKFLPSLLSAGKWPRTSGVPSSQGHSLWLPRPCHFCPHVRCWLMRCATASWGTGHGCARSSQTMLSWVAGQAQQDPSLHMWREPTHEVRTSQLMHLPAVPGCVQQKTLRDPVSSEQSLPQLEGPDMAWQDRAQGGEDPLFPVRT